jgi:acetyl-CoA C-acetyltransferase
LSLRHGSPASALAERLAAGDAEARCSGMGGNIPQWLVDRAAELVVAGHRPLVLIAGAEALATRRRAKKAGVHLEWPGDGGWPDTWPALEPDLGVHGVERAAGLEQATAIYALVQSALDHAAGRDPDSARLSMGALMARFNQVATANPHSWFPTRRSAQELTTVTSDNRIIFHPYPKYLNAVMDVDMAAAVLVTDAQSARELGMSADEVAYVRGWADATEIWNLSARPAVYRTRSLAACAGSALSMAGISIVDVGAFDLYSCFPSSVEAALDALDLAADDPRPLTLTGGLPYHGGPGSNYVTHCIANAFDWLRHGEGDHALVHGNGYYLTKHAVGLYSHRPPEAAPVPDETVQSRLDADAEPRAVHDTMPGPARVVAYTVPFDRVGAVHAGVVLSESPRGRTVAVADPALTEHLLSGDAVGDAVVLEAAGGPDLARCP